MRVVTKKHERGQSAIEIVALFIVIAAAVFLMRAYIQRGLQGGIKDNADKIGTPWSYEAENDEVNTYYEYIVTNRITTETRYSNGVVKTEYNFYNTFQNITTNVSKLEKDDRIKVLPEGF